MHDHMPLHDGKQFVGSPQAFKEHCFFSHRRHPTVSPKLLQNLLSDTRSPQGSQIAYVNGHGIDASLMAGRPWYSFALKLRASEAS